MLLAVDIGNTNIKLALLKEEKIFRSWRLITDKGASIKQYQRLLKELLSEKKVQNASIEGVIICSVVPKLTIIFQKVLRFLLKIRPLILGKDIAAPIKNLYKKPEQVGQDRLANAIAAFGKYGGPVIVVDFGTALTFDVVSAKGSYLGGIIVPGMEVSLKALTKKADLLPEISLQKPRAFLGRETKSSMNSGIIYGYSFLVEGILQQLKRKFKPKAQVVATGGAAFFMLHYCPSINRIDSNLTIMGLKICFQRRKQAKIDKK